MTDSSVEILRLGDRFTSEFHYHTTPAAILMEEIHAIVAKYDHEYVGSWLQPTGDVEEFALTFFEDVGEIYELMTRLRNVERNPSGFSLQDAPILGLLVQIWKLLKLIVWFFRRESVESVSVAERSLIEVAVTASYLLKSDASVIEDYRLCGYKNRVTILEELETVPDLSGFKAGQRLQKSIRKKLESEALNPSSFAAQKKNG